MARDIRLLAPYLCAQLSVTEVKASVRLKFATTLRYTTTGDEVLCGEGRWTFWLPRRHVGFNPRDGYFYTLNTWIVQAKNLGQATFYDPLVLKGRDHRGYDNAGQEISIRLSSATDEDAERRIERRRAREEKHGL